MERDFFDYQLSQEIGGQWYRPTEINTIETNTYWHNFSSFTEDRYAMKQYHLFRHTSNSNDIRLSYFYYLKVGEIVYVFKARRSIGHQNRIAWQTTYVLKEHVPIKLSEVDTIRLAPFLDVEFVEEIPYRVMDNAKIFSKMFEDKPLVLFLEGSRNGFTYIENPNLNKLGLSKAFDANELVQELAMFLNRSKDQASQLRSDKEKILSHGFDTKSSFRGKNK